MNKVKNGAITFATFLKNKIVNSDIYLYIKILNGNRDN